MEWQEKLERERKKVGQIHFSFQDFLDYCIWSLCFDLWIYLWILYHLSFHSQFVVVVVAVNMSHFGSIFFFGNVNDDHDDKKRYSGANLNQQQQNVKVLFFLALFIIENYESFGKIYDFEFHNFIVVVVYSIYMNHIFCFVFGFFGFNQPSCKKKFRLEIFFFILFLLLYIRYKWVNRKTVIQKMQKEPEPFHSQNCKNIDDDMVRMVSKYFVLNFEFWIFKFVIIN